VVSDRDGRFSLPAPEGRHNVVATKTGFARGQATTVAGAGPVEIRLRRGAAISGRIIDEFGDPVVAARVFIEAPRTSAVVATTGTDDRGEYRIGGLSAGTFSVAVLTAGSSIRGRILFEPSLGSRAPNPWEVELSPIPVDYDLSPQSNFASADIRPNGSFAIEGINGPRRLEVVAAPPGWALKEIRASGINVTDQILPFGTADESLRDVEVVSPIASAS